MYFQEIWNAGMHMQIFIKTDYQESSNLKLFQYHVLEWVWETS